MVGIFVPGVGRLVPSRYQFEDHVDGLDFRHNSHDIDVNPSVTIDGYAYTTVATALDAIADYIGVDILKGIGFISIGDGYDTFANSDLTPDTPYDSTTPALNTVLDDLLNNSSNPLHYRIRLGGVVFIPAGTYKFTSTVNVPPGIIIMGESYGTKIVNEMSSPAPLFKIKADTTRTADNGIDAVGKFMFSRDVMLHNLTIADNHLIPKFLGDLSYKNPVNNNSVQPLVSVEEGASLICDNVKFVGKTVYTLGVISNITSFAVRTDSSVPVSSGTLLTMRNCFIDGFAVPVDFSSSGGTNDYFTFTNNYIRAHGFLNSDFVSRANNAILKVKNCHTIVANNQCFGNDDTVTSLVYYTPAVSNPSLQAYVRVNVSNNTIAIDKASVSNNTTFQPIYLAAPMNGTTLHAYGNNYNGIFTLIARKLGLNPGSISMEVDGYINMTSASVNVSTGSVAMTLTGDMTMTVGDDFTVNATGDLDVNGGTGFLHMLPSSSRLYTSNDFQIDGYGINLRAIDNDCIISATTGEVDISAASLISLSPAAGQNLRIGNSASTTHQTIYGSQSWHVRQLASNLVVDTTTRDMAILVNTSSARTITLPDPTEFVGRILIIKDYTGSAGTNNITINRFGSEQIEGVSGSYTINTNRGKVCLIAGVDGNWHVLHT